MDDKSDSKTNGNDRANDTTQDEPTSRRPTPNIVFRARKASVSSRLFQRAAAPRFGRYLVLGELGSGGMGTVREAYDDELDRRVALKLLHPEFAAPQSSESIERHRARLRREAQALAKLSHPNVVQVFEVGEIEDQPFVALELVPGPTLRKWQTRRPRPGWRRIVEVYLGAGRGLAAAHAVGLVHRDFKPDNCVVDSSGRARVLDFGLVMLEETAPTERELRAHDSGVTPRDDALGTSLTHTGTAMGTPGYMPPEQLEGRTADSLSDQFAFCVSLYQAVYGERPFPGKTAIEICEAMRKGGVRPPPRGTRVPQRLRTILLRGLAIEPQQRWPSMNALLRKLEKVVAPRWTRSRVLGLSGVCVGLTAALVIGKVWASPEPCTGSELTGIWDEVRRVEVEQALRDTDREYARDTWAHIEPHLDAYASSWQDKHTEVCEATRVYQVQTEADMERRMGCLASRRLELSATVDALARVDAETLERAGDLVSALSSLAGCDDLAALSAQVPPPADADQARAVAAGRGGLVEARVRRLARESSAALESIDEVIREAERLGYAPLHAEALVERGEAQDDLGHYEEAEHNLVQAYLLGLENDHLDVQGRAARALAWVVGHQQGRWKRGNDWGQIALALSRSDKTDPALRAEALGTVGVLLRDKGHHAEAIDAFTEVLELHETSFGRHHPMVAATLHALGNAMMLGDQLDQADESFVRTLEIQERTLGTLHPSLARTLGSMGTLQMRRGDFDSALSSYERALDIQQRHLPPDHEDLGKTLGNIGHALHERGEIDRALVAHRQSIEILERALGPEHINVAQARANIARALEHQGKLADALMGYRQALEGIQTELGDNHPLVAQTLDNIGVVLEKQDRLDAALDHHQRAQTIFEEVLGPEHPAVANVLSNIGDVRLKQGEHAAASAAYERALAIVDASEAPPTAVVYPRLGLAQIALRRGAPSTAREHATTIDELAKTGHNVAPEVLAKVGDILKSTGHAAP